MENGRSRKDANRKIRQDALREWLSEKCTAQHLVNNIVKIEQLDHESEHFNNELNKLRVANEQRLKVLGKYLPDLKATEITGDGGSDVKTTYKIEFVSPSKTQDKQTDGDTDSTV